MPQWNSVSFRERQVEPRSPDFSFNPAGDSRLSARYWFDWADLVTADGTAFPAAQKALLGYAIRTHNASLVNCISRSGELEGAGLVPPCGRLSFPHPDFPTSYGSYYLAEQFSSVRPDVTAGQSVRLTAQADEGNVVISFRHYPRGYRLLRDTTVVTPVGASNPAVDPTVPVGGVGGGTGTALPAIGVPNEYFCCRAMEIEEKMTVKAQSIPLMSGLVWADSTPDAITGRRTAAILAGAIPLYKGEISIAWYPVPLDCYDEFGFLAAVGSTNSNPFPPTAPPGCPPSLLSQKPAGTLIMGQPEKEIITMGNGEMAYRIRLRMAYHIHGANYFFWAARPAALGGPGYARVARPDGSVMFPALDWAQAFVPP